MGLSERGIIMKMKKIVSIAISAALLVSMAAATAFAVESTPSRTSSDADTGITDVTTSGEGQGLNVEVKITSASSSEEQALKNQGVSGYFGAEAASSATSVLGTSSMTVSGLKELDVTGYDAAMGSATVRVPFAGLPAAGSKVVALVRVVLPDGSVANLPVAGTIVEVTEYVNGVAKKVRKVQFTLDSVTMVNVQAGNAYVAAVTAQ